MFVLKFIQTCSLFPQFKNLQREFHHFLYKLLRTKEQGEKEGDIFVIISENISIEIKIVNKPNAPVYLCVETHCFLLFDMLWLLM